MIPRVVHQYWEDPTGEGRTPTSRLQGHMASWAEHHPDHRVRVWSATDIEGPLREAGDDDAVEAFRALRFPSARSDLARLALVYVEGGTYTDIRNRATRPFLAGLSDFEAAIVTEHPRGIPDPEDRLSNAFLASPPGHPLWRRALKRAVRNVRERRQLTVAALTGIGPLESAMAFATHRALRPARRWEAGQTDRSGTALMGRVGHVMVPTDVAWWTGEGSAGWMGRGGGPYLEGVDTEHWSEAQASVALYR